MFYIKLLQIWVYSLTNYTIYYQQYTYCNNIYYVFNFSRISKKRDLKPINQHENFTLDKSVLIRIKTKNVAFLCLRNESPWRSIYIEM